MLPAPDIAVEMDASDYGIYALDVSSQVTLTYQFTDSEHELVAAFKDGAPNGLDINFREVPHVAGTDNEHADAGSLVAAIPSYAAKFSFLTPRLVAGITDSGYSRSERCGEAPLNETGKTLRLHNHGLGSDRHNSARLSLCTAQLGQLSATSAKPSSSQLSTASLNPVQVHFSSQALGLDLNSLLLVQRLRLRVASSHDTSSAAQTLARLEPVLVQGSRSTSARHTDPQAALKTTITGAVQPETSGRITSRPKTRNTTLGTATELVCGSEFGRKISLDPEEALPACLGANRTLTELSTCTTKTYQVRPQFSSGYTLNKDHCIHHDRGQASHAEVHDDTNWSLRSTSPIPSGPTRSDAGLRPDLGLLAATPYTRRRLHDHSRSWDQTRDSQLRLLGTLGSDSMITAKAGPRLRDLSSGLGLPAQTPYPQREPGSDSGLSAQTPGGQSQAPRDSAACRLSPDTSRILFSTPPQYGFGSEGFIRSDSITAVLLSVQHFFAASGHDFPIAHLQIRMLIKGISRLDWPPRQKPPVSLGLVEACFRSLAMTDPFEQALWGAMCLAFVFLLGRSEIVAIIGGSFKWFAVPAKDIAVLDVEGRPTSTPSNAQSVTEPICTMARVFSFPSVVSPFVLVSVQTICHHCHGKGAAHEEDVHVCSACGGQGVKMTTRRVGPGFIQQFQTTCEKCHGKGKIYTSTCPVCGGRKVEMTDLNFDVDLEKGTPDGLEVELENYADEIPGQPAGHVRLQVLTAPHPVFTREGDHLFMDMDISLRESLVGFTKTFTHLDGRRVEVVRDEITPPRFVTVLKDEGMPKQHSPSERGQLHIKFHVQFPETLSDEQKVGFRELFSMNLLLATRVVLGQNLLSRLARRLRHQLQSQQEEDCQQHHERDVRVVIERVRNVRVRHAHDEVAQPVHADAQRRRAGADRVRENIGRHDPHQRTQRHAERDHERHRHQHRHDEHAGQAPQDHVTRAEAVGQYAREEGGPNVDEVDDERADTRVGDAGVREDAARVVEHGVDAGQLLRTRQQDAAQKLHAVARVEHGLLLGSSQTLLRGLRFLVHLQPRQSRLHVLLAVQTSDDLLGLLRAALGQQPRGTLNAHGRRQHHVDHGQDARERGQVAPARARVGEEEADRGEQNADGGEDLQAQTQRVAHVRRRQLVHVRADGARGSARRQPRDQTASGERPDIGDRSLDHAAHEHEDAVEHQSLLTAEAVAEVAAAQRADHGAEDPRVHGERPLQLRVAREHEARVLGHGARIALVRVVVLRQVRLRGGPTALERLQPRQESARVQDGLGLDEARGGLVGLVERRGVAGLGRRGFRVVVRHTRLLVCLPACLLTR
ncbi:hypothetical protein ON010_g7334 [Phytophthora cinnamomi]|nr:hypothetical protein ON010_g7334 [Phytophthora cinnamomi]